MDIFLASNLNSRRTGRKLHHKGPHVLFSILVHREVCVRRETKNEMRLTLTQLTLTKNFVMSSDSECLQSMFDGFLQSHTSIGEISNVLDPKDTLVLLRLVDPTRNSNVWER